MHQYIIALMPVKNASFFKMAFIIENGREKPVISWTRNHTYHQGWP